MIKSLRVDIPELGGAEPRSPLVQHRVDLLASRGSVGAVVDRWRSGRDNDEFGPAPVGSIATDDLVSSSAAAQQIVRGVALNHIIALETIDHIETLLPAESVVATLAQCRPIRSIQ